MEYKLLKPYKDVLNRLTLFIRRYDKHPNQADRQLILNTLGVVKTFSTSIRLNVDDKDVPDDIDTLRMAYKLKSKMVTYFDQCISAFEYQRDFNNEVEDTRNKLDETISIDEVALLQPLTVPDKPLQQEKEINPFPRIFSNNIAFQIFKSLHSNYKDKPNKTANYSFIYYAMGKDKFILCGGTEFKNFLSNKYEIEIDRTDSRQSGKNNKTDFYNQVKESMR